MQRFSKNSHYNGRHLRLTVSPCRKVTAPGPGAYGCASVRLPSVRPSVACIRPPHATVAGLLLWAQRPVDIDRPSTQVLVWTEQCNVYTTVRQTDWLTECRLREYWTIRITHCTSYLPQSAASQNYNLRHRTHDKQLHQHQGHLTNCNFMTRLLYKNSYWLSNICEC